MIDLRSDTLTQPDLPMLETILTAPVGDDGRIDENGRGEDPTVNKLEDLAASLTGKEAGLLCCSGSMTNLTALLYLVPARRPHWSTISSTWTKARKPLFLPALASSMSYVPSG